jgi:sugar lactone lactonase YvrE
MIHKLIQCAAAVLTTALLVAACGGGGDDSRAQPAGTQATALGSPVGDARGLKGDKALVSTYATGLTNPRGLVFGPDGLLYVAEAGTGGTQVATDTPDCKAIVNIYSPYKAGYTGRVVRVLADGSVQTVADRLPSMTDVYGGSLGPTDLAFIGGTLYVLIEMGGCSHGLPNDDAAILRINPDGSTTRVANLSAWLAVNPPRFTKDTNPATTDLEPGGVFHSMIAVDGMLYVVETNGGQLVKVDPATGAIERLYDMSIDKAEHNPIVMAQHRGKFYVGTFGEDGGPAELAVFDANFAGYTLPFKSLNPIVGLAWRRERLYAVEIFPLDEAWTPDNANLVSFNPATGERKVLASKFASFPNGLIVGPDGALYTSNVGSNGAPGDGGVLRIVVP